MDELKSFLEEDLRNLFEDKGIDESKYEEEMEFEDPITSYRTLSGYLLNIQMLRYLFNPKFQLHSVTQTGEHELTTRWTMEMEFMGKFVPQGLWRPQLAWTGLSIMQVNPQTGKFCKHVDIWDSIKDNSYFSLEGLQDLIRQLTQFYRTPDLETPAYTVLRRFKDYEIRLYKSFKVAESKADNQMARGEAFMKLAGFIFGENEEKRKVAMTTPVFFTGDTLQFVLGSDTGDDGLTPVRDDIACTSMQGGVYACLKFNGLATEEEARERASELRQLLKESGYEAVGEEIVARYNDPSTLPFVRRNEVIIPLGITPESLLV